MSDMTLAMAWSRLLTVTKSAATVDTSKWSVWIHLFINIRDKIWHPSRDEGKDPTLALEIFDSIEIFPRYTSVVRKKSAVKVGTNKYSFKFFHSFTSGII